MKVVVLNNSAIATYDDYSNLPENGFPESAAIYYVPSGTSVLGSPEQSDPETGELITPAVSPLTEAEIQAIAVPPPVDVEAMKAQLETVEGDFRDYKIEVEERLSDIEARLITVETSCGL